MRFTTSQNLRRTICLSLAVSPLALAATAAGVRAQPSIRDTAYPGVVGIDVDARDLDHRMFKVRESVPVAGGTVATLLFPKWSTDHAPNGPIDHIAALQVSAAGAPLTWKRDPSDPYAFRVSVPSNVRELEVSYDIVTSLTPDQGTRVMNDRMFDLQWPTVLLYPAGYDVSRIAYRATLHLPPDWSFASALGGVKQGDTVAFDQAPLDVLAESPVMGARYLRRTSIVAGPIPMQIDVAGETPDVLTPPPGLAEGYRRLAAEAKALFGATHYDHYDVLEWLSDDLGPLYYEHPQSQEGDMTSALFHSWDSRPDIRTRFAHDYVHSWNGQFRRPAGMAMATFNQPQQDSMLWVTEGLTEYWSKVLAVRAGLITRADYLDGLTATAARISTEPGARWRPLDDVGVDAIIANGAGEPWPDWQRMEFDTYGQGELIWLEADALIRERTGGRRSLDDFAASFFGRPANASPTFTRADMVAGLNRIAPYDWAGFFQTRVDKVDPTPGLGGLERAGYRLTYTDTPSQAQAAAATKLGVPSLRYSLGLSVDGKGKVVAVVWDSPAWRAGMTVGSEITEVNSAPYSPKVIEAATRASRGTIRLTTSTGSPPRTYAVTWQGGLRFPHLIPIAGRSPLLDDALRPRVPSDSRA